MGTARRKMCIRDRSHSGMYAGTYMTDKTRQHEMCQWGPVSYTHLGYVHHRVRRGLDVDGFCIFFHIAFHVITVAVDAGKFDAVFLVHMVEQTNASAVQIGIRNDEMCIRDRTGSARHPRARCKL